MSSLSNAIKMKLLRNRQNYNKPKFEHQSDIELNFCKMLPSTETETKKLLCSDRQMTTIDYRQNHSKQVISITPAMLMLLDQPINVMWSRA
jgi:hypothetical protein